MLISLAVLLLPVVVLVGGYQILADRQDPVPVDPSARVAAAERAGMEVAEPADLGPAWVPVSAVFDSGRDGATLRIGYVTPDGDPVQVVQSTVPPAQLLKSELTAHPRPDGVVTLAHQRWERYPGRSGERALVSSDATRTVLVVGPADESLLRELAVSLR